jgi:hypothetical protein
MAAAFPGGGLATSAGVARPGSGVGDSSSAVTAAAVAAAVRRKAGEGLGPAEGTHRPGGAPGPGSTGIAARQETKQAEP